MAASWEIREANKVVCCILHVDTTTVAWSFGLRNLIIPGREELRRFSPFCPVAGQPFDMARNTSVQYMFDVGAEWWFSLDSDVVMPRDGLLRLLAHKQPFISGMYCRRSLPHGVPVMIKNGTWFTDFVPGSVVEVDLVGAGALLIHRSVFERVQQRPEQGKKWFDWRVDQLGLPNIPPDKPSLSEDFTYCAAVRAAGYKVLCDTSVYCKHVGSCQAGFGSLVPLETTPIT